MTEQELAEIEAKAKAASPGPWFPCPHMADHERDEQCPCGTRGSIWSVADELLLEMGVTESEPMSDMLPRPDRHTTIANARFIAAANPETVLRLIARIRQLEGQGPFL